MAVPFRKVSKTRRDMRRTHYKVTANGLVECTNCGAKIRPHRACPKCGFYKGVSTSKESSPWQSQAFPTMKLPRN